MSNGEVAVTSSPLRLQREMAAALLGRRIARSREGDGASLRKDARGDWCGLRLVGEGSGCLVRGRVAQSPDPEQWRLGERSQRVSCLRPCSSLSLNPTPWSWWMLRLVNANVQGASSAPRAASLPQAADVLWSLGQQRTEKRRGGGAWFGQDQGFVCLFFHRDFLRSLVRRCFCILSLNRVFFKSVMYFLNNE
ncbi:hypothetical protein BRADI_1g20799v3 [Brachypodium distachyon]|uniref:Uncharacterized protein n=1 Tax=Brachypodium distachyon TaxID=15368 RepID=A0A2K2DKA9_BRADI|nr:hypothetical protein BRADI_1g20799v3 [Brachypodium distachyon]